MNKKLLIVIGSCSLILLLSVFFIFGRQKFVQQKSPVQRIYSTKSAFAALREDGSVITWGSRRTGGDSSSVAGQLKSGVKVIYSTKLAFAAVKEDGSVITWGGRGNGADSSSVAGQLKR